MNTEYGFKMYIVTDREPEVSNYKKCAELFKTYNHNCEIFDMTHTESNFVKNMLSKEQSTFPFILCEGNNYLPFNQLEEFLKMIKLSKCVVDDDSDNDSENYGELITNGEILLSSQSESNRSLNNANNTTDSKTTASKDSDEDLESTESSDINGFDSHGNDDSSDDSN